MMITKLRTATHSNIFRLLSATAVLTVLVALALAAETGNSSAPIVSGIVKSDVRTEAPANESFSLGPIVHAADLAAIDPIPSNDTPEGMMAIGKEGQAGTREATAALNDITALTNRMSSDKAYATKLLAAIQKNDSASVTSILKETMTRSEFTVRNIKSDFHFEIDIKTSTLHFHACFSSDHSCDGHNVVLG
jgi:hypothetical protein